MSGAGFARYGAIAADRTGNTEKARATGYRARPSPDRTPPTNHVRCRPKVGRSQLRQPVGSVASLDRDRTRRLVITAAAERVFDPGVRAQCQQRCVSGPPIRVILRSGSCRDAAGAQPPPARRCGSKTGRTKAVAPARSSSAAHQLQSGRRPCTASAGRR